MGKSISQNAILVLLVLLGPGLAIDTIADFKSSFFQISHPNTGVYKIDVGYNE